MILVNERAEDFYDKSEQLGTLAAETFLEEIHYQGHGGLTSKDERTLQRHRAQLTGLENIAETTLKAADVLDYIKKQIARPDRKGWREEYKGEHFGESLKQMEAYKGKRFGESLKQMIENNLKADVEHICAEMRIGKESDEHKRDRQYIYLQLIRQLVRQVVVQYEYRVSEIEEKKQNAQRTGVGTNTASQR